MSFCKYYTVVQTEFEHTVLTTYFEELPTRQVHKIFRNVLLEDHKERQTNYVFKVWYVQPYLTSDGYKRGENIQLNVNTGYNTDSMSSMRSTHLNL